MLRVINRRRGAKFVRTNASMSDGRASNGRPWKTCGKTDTKMPSGSSNPTYSASVQNPDLASGSGRCWSRPIEGTCFGTPSAIWMAGRSRKCTPSAAFRPYPFRIRLVGKGYNQQGQRDGGIFCAKIYQGLIRLNDRPPGLELTTKYPAGAPWKLAVPSILKQGSFHQ
jgi:hypothetical protein